MESAQLQIDSKREQPAIASLVPHPTSSIRHIGADWATFFAHHDTRREQVAPIPMEVILDLLRIVFGATRRPVG
ncbi:MAG: hypothetical protein CFE29_07330 [Bradyrhizobiaceae bacterium PARB1]|nr:MAG: hypothetical protein CFE29_07330 [Bradyrhizobiaceae bacterium PARB1]